MEVILLENVGGLGNVGDKVAVKPGYGRNYLIPQGKAAPATADNLAAFEERRAELEAAAAAKMADAEKRAAAVSALEAITIGAHASEEGKLFGSVGTREIADAITAAGVEVEKSEVLLPTGAIRDTCEYDIEIQLHVDVVAPVKVIVVAE